ncbi:hypothetical protein I4F81_007435 [Pyropia yezoensis]|uniref:Uncharacterized protein n=1 Tax=Pyropia yezoensis TaxID=2788 RepID=A0ACC3C436_PYRYE|nr:hypothetical protein I4F81_007435 [Neopyropia yezoensis]
MATPAFVPIAPGVTKSAAPTRSISSSFTPGTSRLTGAGGDAAGGSGGAASSPASCRPRMRVAVATPSKKSAAAAAAAIRKAGGVDPVTHHVAETLRQGRSRRAPPVGDAPPRWERPTPPTTPTAPRTRVSPADAAAAARAAVGSEAAKAWAARRSVVAGTAVGGGRMGGDAVALDAQAKQAAWAAELATLRSADAVAFVRAPTVAPRTALPVGGRRTTAYEARMARLASHATTSAVGAATKAPAASVAYGTAAGGGWATSEAVAADAVAKRDTWATEMASLRSGGTPVKKVVPRSRQAIATSAPIYTPAPMSLPQSVSVVGAQRTATAAYTLRMQRLSAYAEATAASSPPLSAAAEKKRRGWFHKRGVSLVGTSAPAIPASRATATAGAGGGVVARIRTATGGDSSVPRPQRLVAAALAVTLSMSAGLPKGSKRAAALSWLMSGC